ncbi:MAG: Pr6Pr family membrane protein [Candidatus Ventricola sp.]
MVVVIPEEPFGRLGAILSALIAAVSLIGLTVHKDFYAGRRRRDFFCYYTNMSNLLVLLYFALLAPRLYASARLRPLIPHAEFSLMMSIMLTFMVFHHLLSPAIYRQMRDAPRDRDFAIVFVDNFIIHYLVPWLVLFYWVLCSPGKRMLSVLDALLWTLVPLAYLAFIFLRAPLRGDIEDTDSPYPYPFLNVRRLGVRRVAAACTLLYGACAVVGLVVVALTQLSFAYFGGGHALILI